MQLGLRCKLQDELRESGLQGFHAHPQFHLFTHNFKVKLAQLPLTQVQQQREQCLQHERKNIIAEGSDRGWLALRPLENLIHKAKIKSSLKIVGLDKTSAVKSNGQKMCWDIWFFLVSFPVAFFAQRPYLACVHHPTAKKSVLFMCKV